MYEIKGRTQLKLKPVKVVVEDAADVIEAANKAIEMGITTIYSVSLIKAAEAWRFTSTTEEVPEWYNATFITNEIDENTGKEKKVNQQMLIEEMSLDGAHAKLNEILSQGYDFGAQSIKRTNIDAVVTMQESVADIVARWEAEADCKPVAIEKGIKTLWN